MKSEGKAAAAKPNAKVRPEVSPAAKAEKDRYNKIWSTSIKIKQEFLHSLQGATEIAQLILDAEEWSFANNEQHRGKLIAEMQMLKSQLGPFHKRMLTEDKTSLTKDFTVEHQLTELTSFNALKPAVERLSKLVRKLVKKKQVENED